MKFSKLPLWLAFFTVIGLITTASADRAHAASSYKLIEDFTGKQFFSHFKFETFDDPTRGFVDYVSESRAKHLGLIAVNPDGKVRIAVESKEKAYGRGRAAVRLKSKTTYNSGLVIIDIAHLPTGNAVWPAFWTLGPNWPNTGEIDVIEGINDQAVNQATLHTQRGCVMPPTDPKKMTGRFGENLDCNNANGYIGCTTFHPNDSFGPGLNKNGGAVFAMLWTKSGISIWYWPHTAVPRNISTGETPDPNQWGLPTSIFEFGDNCPANFVKNQNIIINTTFCGGWAGATFSGPTGRGPDACNFYVSKYPEQFTEAYWDINSLRVYSVP